MFGTLRNLAARALALVKRQQRDTVQAPRYSGPAIPVHSRLERLLNARRGRAFVLHANGGRKQRTQGKRDRSLRMRSNRRKAARAAKYAAILFAFALPFGFAPPVHAQTVTVSASNLYDGTTPANGTIVFAPVLANGQAASYRYPGGGQRTVGVYTATVTNGAFTITLPDTSQTNPQNLCFNVVLTGTRNRLGPGYSCVQPAASNSWCSSGACNFDNYIPNEAALVVEQTGPQGPQGPAGPSIAGLFSDGANGIAVQGKVSADNGHITTDGSGNLTLKSDTFSSAAVTLFPSVSGDAGAAVNTAFTNNNVVVVSTATSPTATTTITIPNAATGLNGIPGTLRVEGNGTFTVPQVLFQDSTTAAVQSGVLDCPGHATIKLAASSNKDLISDTNFSSLTGTTNGYGALGAKINGCIIDGDKSGNTSGWGVRLYGRKILITDSTIQNAASGGLWAENHDSASFSTPADDDAQGAIHVKTITNNGDGIYVPQGQGWTFTDAISWGNSSWGIEVASAVALQGFNTYLNTTGGCRVDANGSVVGSNVACTNAAGWGLLVDSGAGDSIISSGNFGCNTCIGIELRAPSQRIDGVVANSATAVKFNGGSGILNLVAFSNTTIFNCTSVSGSPIVSLYTADGSQTIFDSGTCGTVPTTGLWTWLAPGDSASDWPFQTFHAGGWTYTLPNANGNLFVQGAGNSLTVGEITGTSTNVFGGYTFTFPNLNGTLAVMNNGSQTGPFYAGSLNAPVALDPGSPSNGAIWYNTTVNQLKAEINGAAVIMGPAPLSGTTGSIGGSALALNACTSGTATVTGATTSMVAVTNPVSDPNSGTTQDYDWYARVTSAGTVTVYECAIIAGTPTATTFNVRVIP